MIVALLAAVTCGVGLLLAGLPDAFSPVGQWDFEAYYFALKVYDAGGNPWETPEVVKAAGRAVWPFLYPHHTFLFFRLFDFDDLGKAKDVYLATRLACVAFLLVLWTYGFVRKGGRGWFLAFAALGCNATICRDLAVGNVSIVEQVPLWLGLFALLKGRLWAFCALVILAGQFKMLPIALVGLVLTTDAKGRWMYLWASVLACVGIAAGVYLSNPWAARTFAHLTFLVGTMEPGGSINPNSLALFRELCDGLLRSSDFLGDVTPKQVANVVYGVFAVAMVGAYAWRVRRGMETRTALFVGVLTYVLLAPRMKDYSYIIALVPTFELIRGQLSRPNSLKWMIVGAALLLALPGFDMSWQYRPLLLAGWAWLVGMTSAAEDLPQPTRIESGPRMHGATISGATNKT
jgi:hypothetical protein